MGQGGEEHSENLKIGGLYIPGIYSQNTWHSPKKVG